MNAFDDKKFAQEAVRAYADGDIIFREGDDSREMYVVKEGEVSVVKTSKRGEVELARLRKGDFVGEMSLLESLPRSATARARGNTKLLAIHPGGFLLKIRRDPTFAFEMMQALSRRIRVTNENLMRELDSEGLGSEAIERIISKAEFENGEEADKDRSHAQANGSALTDRDVPT